MPEKTKTDRERSSDVPKYMWAALAFLIVFVYFFGLTIPFLGPDEARYAQVAREMFDRGDWVTPTLGDFHWFEKPALLYWLQIASYHLFGVNEFAARFGPAAFGLGTIASLWMLGRRSNFENASQFANFLALIAASTLGILVFSRGASFDIIITFPITAALVSFYIYDHPEPRSSKRSLFPLVLFYLFVGLSLLAKGLIGIVFPFAIVAFYYLISLRLPGRQFLVSLIWGTLLAVVVASIWYWPMYQRHGYEFINEFFIQHHFQRFTSNKYQHPQPFYFFFWVLPLMTLPWLPFFAVALWRQVRSLISGRSDAGDQTGKRSLQRFAIAWLLVPLVFFSFSGSKLPGYILPAVPAAIILTAVFAFELAQKSIKWRRSILGLSITTFLFIIGLLIFALPRFAETDSVKSLIAAANERGYGEAHVLGFHTVSHNAEFYAAGRLLRDETGKQRKLYNLAELNSALASQQGRPALVLVPLRYLENVTRNLNSTSEFIKDNGELAIVAVTAK
ncbi:MAG: glycosyltransferase family 39 protein [Pyrinomonadaceae bacterium]